MKIGPFGTILEGISQSELHFACVPRAEDSAKVIRLEKPILDVKVRAIEQIPGVDSHDRTAHHETFDQILGCHETYQLTILKNGKNQITTPWIAPLQE